MLPPSVHPAPTPCSTHPPIPHTPAAPPPLTPPAPLHHPLHLPTPSHHLTFSVQVDICGTFCYTGSSWKPATDGGCKIRGYRLYRSSWERNPAGTVTSAYGNWTQLSGDVPALSLDATARSITAYSTDIAERNFYKFKVGIVTNKGEYQTADSTVQALGLADALSVSPTQSITQSSTSQIALSWTVPKNNGGIIHG